MSRRSMPKKPLGTGITSLCCPGVELWKNESFCRSKGLGIVLVYKRRGFKI